MTRQDTQPRAPRGRQRRAFTVMELLVVITILGILLTLGAGVGLYMLRRADREKTIATQKIIIEAIAAYVDETGAEPVVSGTPDNATANLLTELLLSTAAREILQKLPDGAVKANASNKQSFFDAYNGKEMRYYPKGGLGGRPRLVSAGPDGSFTSENDNILSDEN